MLYILAVILVVSCTDIVPAEKAEAFRRKQAKIEAFQALQNELAWFETEKGSFAIQFLPVEDISILDRLRSWVDSGAYAGLRFHRALHAPVEYGVQIGDPRTRGAEITEVAWPDRGEDANHDPASMGFRSFAEPVSFAGPANLPALPGAVYLVGRPGFKELGSHLFLSTGTHLFMEDSALAVGYVVSGRNVLFRLQQGDAILDTRFVARNDLEEEAGQPVDKLPDIYAKWVQAHKPTGM